MVIRSAVESGGWHCLIDCAVVVGTCSLNILIGKDVIRTEAIVNPRLGDMTAVIEN